MDRFSRDLEDMRIKLDGMVRIIERDNAPFSKRRKEALEHIVRARQAVGLANYFLSQRGE